MKFRKYAYYIIIALLLIIFLISAFYVGSYVLDSREQKTQYNNLAAIVENARTEVTEAAGEALKDEDPENAGNSDEASDAEESPILPEYRDVYALNSDLVGWLSIDDTEVNYPVVQTPENPDYYLYRNFEQEYNVHGCLYAREACDVNAPSDNITIYGHHMRDGTMFGSLKYYQKKSYWEEHSTLRFDTLTERHTYEIFAVFKTTASQGEGFAYHQFVDAESEEAFDEFISTCKGLSFYKTGITPEYGDKIICLSTCEYTQQNGRFVVAAVRID